MEKRFKGLSSRVLISTGLILTLVMLLWGADYIWVQCLTVTFVALIAVTAMFEYTTFVRIKGEPPSVILLSVVSFAWVFLSYVYADWVWLVVLFNFFFLCNFRRMEGSIYRIATGGFAIFYILIPVGMVINLLYPEGIGSKGNVLWVIYLILVTKITDIGAYFVGKLMGKHKLAPSISPGKTWEGAIFGVIVAVLSSYLFIPHLFTTFLQATLLGLAIGVFAEVGDLAESLLKRDAGVKDSNQIPAIGGVLDLIDSLLFTTPLLFAYLRIS